MSMSIKEHSTYIFDGEADEPNPSRFLLVGRELQLSGQCTDGAPRDEFIPTTDNRIFEGKDSFIVIRGENGVVR